MSLSGRLIHKQRACSSLRKQCRTAARSVPTVDLSSGPQAPFPEFSEFGTPRSFRQQARLHDNHKTPISSQLSAPAEDIVGNASAVYAFLWIAICTYVSSGSSVSTFTQALILAVERSFVGPDKITRPRCGITRRRDALSCVCDPRNCYMFVTSGQWFFYSEL